MSENTTETRLEGEKSKGWIVGAIIALLVVAGIIYYAVAADDMTTQDETADQVLEDLEDRQDNLEDRQDAIQENREDQREANQQNDEEMMDDNTGVRTDGQIKLQ